MITIRQEKDGFYTCVNCCGVEDVPKIPSRNAVWNHLEYFHDWPKKDKTALSIKEQ